MKNILFLGGAGFIGSNLVKKISNNKQYKIYVFEPILANIGRLEDHLDVISIIRGVITDTEQIKCIVENYNINIIVHLISTLIPNSNYDDFKREFENIVFPTIKLMEYCADRNVKFVYFSSGGTVYGNSTFHQKFKENDKLSPISYYGLTKQIIENNIVFQNRRRNLQYLIIRPSNPFGPGQSLHGNQGLIAVAIGKILAGDPIQVWGDGSCVRDYIYIGDLADAFYQLINCDVNNETVNIGSGFGYSVNNVIEKLKNFIDFPFKVEYKASRNVDVNSMILDISKLQSLISVKHTHLEDGIMMFYDYILSTLNK